METDKKLIPHHYELQEQPAYLGDGIYNVLQLEDICRRFKEHAHQQNIIKDELIQRLKTINGLTSNTGRADLEFISKIAKI